ncbi:hypothetical protein V1264_009700 [Littorina saxatilis]|uniref:Uncharacterized protein n=1 Tax=Littorina saxatilis TaxID=31220 RepID=A0AAN9ASA2_9CAEN
MGSQNVTLLLAVFFAALFVSSAFPDFFNRRAAESETKEGLASVVRRQVKRLIFFDKCSAIGQKCHPLQHCCGDLKCKYERVFPPKARCQVQMG